jgi:hypothetical protein
LTQRAAREYHYARFTETLKYNFGDKLHHSEEDSIPFGFSPCSCPELQTLRVSPNQLNHHFEMKHYKRWLIEDFVFKDEEKIEYRYERQSISYPQHPSLVTGSYLAIRCGAEVRV